MLGSVYGLYAGLKRNFCIPSKKIVYVVGISTNIDFGNPPLSTNPQRRYNSTIFTVVISGPSCSPAIKTSRGFLWSPRAWLMNWLFFFTILYSLLCYSYFFKRKRNICKHRPVDILSSWAR